MASKTSPALSAAAPTIAEDRPSLEQVIDSLSAETDVLEQLIDTLRSRLSSHLVESDTSPSGEVAWNNDMSYIANRLVVRTHHIRQLQDAVSRIMRDLQA